MAYGLLLLRIVAGLTIAAHGAQKLFGWFGGNGLKGTGAFFGKDFKAGTAMAFLAGLAELGGVLLALGLLTPLAAFGIVVTMATAIRLVHWQNGFFNHGRGYEFNLLLLTVPVALAMTGPGRLSLDRALGVDDNWSGLWWGVGVLVAGLVVSAANWALFHKAPEAQPAA